MSNWKVQLKADALPWLLEPENPSVRQLITAIGTFEPSVTAVTAMALFLAEQGQPERAVELYATASCYPLISNSRWFKDIVGKHIAAAAVTLSPQVVAAAQERGHARDLDATVAELLVELAGSQVEQ